MPAGSWYSPFAAAVRCASARSRAAWSAANAEEALLQPIAVHTKAASSNDPIYVRLFMGITLREYAFLRSGIEYHRQSQFGLRLENPAASSAAAPELQAERVGHRELEGLAIPSLLIDRLHAVQLAERMKAERRELADENGRDVGGGAEDAEGEAEDCAGDGPFE